jgi:hypothetical protein
VKSACDGIINLNALIVLKSRYAADEALLEGLRRGVREGGEFLGVTRVGVLRQASATPGWRWS